MTRLKSHSRPPGLRLPLTAERHQHACLEIGGWLFVTLPLVNADPNRLTSQKRNEEQS